MTIADPETEVDVANRLKESLRDRGDIYRLNLVHPSQGVNDMAETWEDEGIGTVSDWGLLKNHDVELFTDENVPITHDMVAPRFRNELGSDRLDWEAFRDVVAEECYGGKKNPKRHAGQVRGSVRRFVDEFEVGTVVLGNFPDGQVPGVVASDCRFERKNAATEHDPNHVFVRDIKWARDDAGDLLALPEGSLPEALQPARQTTTKVKQPEQLVALAELIDFIISDR